jgi:hypothetical protein
MEAAVEEEEEIAQVASTLARANESRSLIAWMKLIKEEELYLSVNLPGWFLERGGHLNLEGLHLNVLKYAARPVPCSTNKLEGSRVIAGQLANCFWQVLLQGWF